MSGRVTVLTGGVGGAKLVLGLQQVMPAEKITAIVNTGDDFRHFGLHVAPDIDTLLYTLSGKANQAQGWGREGESWSFMEALRSLNEEDWFLLGDGDLALHVVRSHALAQGKPLSAITRDFARSWDIRVEILPMSDDRVATRVLTDEGELDFQRYFVERRCAPAVKSLWFDGIETARPAPGVLEAIASPENDAILIAPSNPFLSVDPILAVPGIRAALANAPAPVVAVTPVIGGQAVKGPTAKLMREFGLEVTPAAIAAHYEAILDGLLIDERDRAAQVSVRHAFADTMMKSLDDRARVARDALALAATLRGR